MTDRLLSSVVAVSLALLVWLYARSRDQEILDNVPIPVQLMLGSNQADHYSLEVNGPSQVMVSFTGSPPRIRELRGMIQRNELHIELTVTVPDERLNESRYSDTIVVEASSVHAPAGVTAMMVEGRNRIPVTLHRLGERQLPVKLDHLQEEMLGPVVLEPATVLVRGPQEVLDRARFITTMPSEMPTRPANALPNAATVARMNLSQELEGRPVKVWPSKVTVRLPARPHRIYDLSDVQVNFLCPANFLLRPKFIEEPSGRINLRLQGPVQEETPRVFAFIDLSRGRFTPGLNHEPLQLQLPKDFSLLVEPPRVMTFELEQADFQPWDGPLKGLPGAAGLTPSSP
jgi:hypothetical protein